MLIAKELLEAFRDSFINLDSEPLEAVTTPKSTITFTSTGETLNQSEMLDWARAKFGWPLCKSSSRHQHFFCSRTTWRSI